MSYSLFFSKKKKQGVANTLWSLSVISSKMNDSTLYKEEVRACVSERTHKPQNINFTCCQLRLLLGRLLIKQEIIDVLLQQVEERAFEMNRTEIVMVISALGTLGINDPNVLEAVIQRARDFEKDLSEVERESIVESLAAINEDMAEIEIFE